MAVPPPVIDAHVHVWELARRPQPWIDPVAMSVLHRDHVVEELTSQLQQSRVEGAILVQVLNDADETDDYLRIAARSDLIGVVGWVDLLARDVAPRLDALLDHPSGASLLGVRHQALAEQDPGNWFLRVGDRGSLRELGRRQLPFDLMFRPEHLATVYDVVRAQEGTTFVLDHGGKPPVLSGWTSDASQAWAARVADLSRLPHVTCKLSGLTTMADLTAWTVRDLSPYVDHLVSCFGPDRLMFGSDWPVSLRAGDYARTVDAARALVSGLAPDEQAAILGGTAQRVYAPTSRLA